jgi:Tfp pilus assembly protein FimT
VELVVVMAIMVSVIGLVAPAFKGFLAGRNLNNEAQRFLFFTRFGMSRAIGEGVPMDLRINVKQGWYAMAATGGYSETWTNETHFNLDKDVKMQVYPSQGTMTQSNSWTVMTGRRARSPVIRFQPDGFISDSSPARIVFQQGQTQILIRENDYHTRYEVQPTQTRTGRF